MRRVSHALDSCGPEIILYRAPTEGSRGQEEPRARRLTVVFDRKDRSETDSMTKKPTRPSPKSNHQIAQMRLRYFEQQRDHMVDTIRRLVEIESPSDNKQAVDRCSAFAAEEFAALGGRAQFHRVADFGNHLQVDF